eukprot:CAMPEP_0119541504 /NCGR_PEP_ID=MMETSP1344-20130328/52998_1 /TAXON_ID=236787 /ORGANISM="Florenciella parvula, Strain CCMP2471" /LENGTH=146 /DNA_ID=CAMNT_0007585491 /DNA_START=16 /DNA_END=456 /DNA_ORIENTATION=+
MASGGGAAPPKSAAALAVDEKMKEYRGLEQLQHNVLNKRQMFLSQLQENELVKNELDLLDDGAPVYKLIGPVLMRQDTDEAKQNVDKRLEFIRDEIMNCDRKVEDNKGKMQTVGEAVMKMQQELQASAASQAQAAADEATAALEAA